MGYWYTSSLNFEVTVRKLKSESAWPLESAQICNAEEGGYEGGLAQSERAGAHQICGAGGGGEEEGVAQSERAGAKGGQMGWLGPQTKRANL
eukprot:12516-Chlamydomonas_euryale.AAC.1